MTMRTASRFVTPCEALRKINDLCQSDSEKDKAIRALLADFEIMAKKLAREVNARPGKKIHDSWWTADNPTWRDLAKMRINDLYK